MAIDSEMRVSNCVLKGHALYSNIIKSNKTGHLHQEIPQKYQIQNWFDNSIQIATAMTGYVKSQE